MHANWFSGTTDIVNASTKQKPEEEMGRMRVKFVLL
jgi:hypothetical protein